MEFAQKVIRSSKHLSQSHLVFLEMVLTFPHCNTGKVQRVITPPIFSRISLKSLSGHLNIYPKQCAKYENPSSCVFSRYLFDVSPL